MIIATRGSALALWQANHVRDRLLALGVPGVELLVLKTRGDKILDRALSEVGGKGLFVKEIEEALLDGRAQVAVHSMKDLPGGGPARADAGARSPSARIRATRSWCVPGSRRGGGASCPRGRAWARRRCGGCASSARRRDLDIVPLRGNVDTRLRKLQAGELDAIVLACAGLRAARPRRRHHRGARRRRVAAGHRPGRAGHRVPRDDAATARLPGAAEPRRDRPLRRRRARLPRAAPGRLPDAAGRARPLDGESVVLEGLVGAPDGSHAPARAPARPRARSPGTPSWRSCCCRSAPRNSSDGPAGAPSAAPRPSAPARSCAGSFPERRG